MRDALIAAGDLHNRTTGRLVLYFRERARRDTQEIAGRKSLIQSQINERNRKRKRAGKDADDGVGLTEEELYERASFDGLTQEELALRCGLSVEWVRKIETARAKRVPRVTLERLAEALKLKPDELTLLMSAYDRERGNLPEPRSAFIGRSLEQTSLKALLVPNSVNTRLVTLTGTGGCGKTRLALQVAHAIKDEYPHGAFLVNLAPLNDASLVLQQVASALHLHEQSGARTLRDTVIDFLQYRTLLLLLDNCEHLSAPSGVLAAADLADTLQAACANLHILATSHKGLDVEGETIFRVPSLTVPDIVQGLSLPKLFASEAVQLFVEAARAQDQNFTISTDNSDAVAQICRRLDGIPLAISLAAGQIAALSPTDIATQLDNCLALLTGGDRTPMRHETMRAALDWSYKLLTEQEQVLLQRLSVFAGGWTLPAALHVCSGDGIAESETLPLFTSLVRKSLVEGQEQGAVRRHRLLETVQQYAAERLKATGEEGRVRDRHCDYYLELVEAESRKSQQQRLTAEDNNLRAALSRGKQAPEPTASGQDKEARLARALWRFWMIHGYLDEGIRYLETMLHGKLDLLQEAKAHNGLGSLFELQGKYAEAQQHHLCSLGLFCALKNEQGIGSALNNLALVLYDQGNFDDAVKRFEESLKHWESDDWRGPAAVRNFFGRALLYRGIRYNSPNDWKAAADILDTCITQYGNLSNESTWGLAVAQCNRGLVACRQGDQDVADLHLRASLERAFELAHKPVIADCLEGLAYLRLGPQQPAWLLGAAKGLREAHRHSSPVHEVEEQERIDLGARGIIEQAEFEGIWEDGHSIGLEGNLGILRQKLLM